MGVDEENSGSNSSYRSEWAVPKTDEAHPASGSTTLERHASPNHEGDATSRLCDRATTGIEPARVAAREDAADAGTLATSMQVSDEAFMRIALEEAQKAADEGEVPIGAVVVFEGRVIAQAHNRRETEADPSAHAEFSALVDAARTLKRWRLTGCTVYVTLEPCLMCAGLMVNARIDRCVFGAPDPKGGAVGTLYDVSNDPRLNHAFQVTAGVLASDAAELLRSFFRARRRKRNT